MILTALTVLVNPLSAGESLKFHSDFNTAMEASKKMGKPIVTIFSAKWCPPCQAMKKRVYPSSAVAPFHDSFVWAYLDADVPANRALMTKYGVQGIPHIAFVAPNGRQLDRSVGAMEPGAFANLLSDVLKKNQAVSAASRKNFHYLAKGSGTK